MRSRVACGMERPGTSFSTTEMVAGFNSRCSANCFSPMVSFLDPGFFFIGSFLETQAAFTGTRRPWRGALSSGRGSAGHASRRPIVELRKREFRESYPSAKRRALVCREGLPALPAKRGHRSRIERYVKRLPANATLDGLLLGAIGQYQGKAAIRILKSHMIDVV